MAYYVSVLSNFISPSSFTFLFLYNIFIAHHTLVIVVLCINKNWLYDVSKVIKPIRIEPQIFLKSINGRCWLQKWFCKMSFISFLLLYVDRLFGSWCGVIFFCSDDPSAFDYRIIIIIDRHSFYLVWYRLTRKYLRSRIMHKSVKLTKQPKRYFAD